MGNEGSCAWNQPPASSSVTLFDEKAMNLPERGLCDPMVYSEFLVDSLFDLPPELDIESNARPPADLIGLLGCPDQVGDTSIVIDELLKSLLATKIGDVARLFQKLKIVGNGRISVHDLHSRWAKWTDQTKKILFSLLQKPFSEFWNVRHHESKSFVEVLLEWGQTDLAKKKVPFSLDEFAQFAAPVQALYMPTPQFYANKPGVHQTFAASHVLRNGMASNGQFLIILCGEGVFQIFSLMEGVVHNPIVTKLDYCPASDDVSVYFEGDLVCVVDGHYIRKYPLAQLIKGCGIMANSEEGRPFAHCHDYFTSVLYDGDAFQAKPSTSESFEWGPGSALISSFRMKQVMATTNGSFIVFIWRDDQATMTYLVYSLLTGVFVCKEDFACTDSVVAVHIDSFNRCTWVVVSCGRQTMELRRFYFPGSCNPGMIDFFIPKVDIKKKCKKCAFRLSNLAAHYVGSQLLPDIFVCSGSPMLRSVIGEAIRLCDLYAEKPRKMYLALIQLYSVIIELNLKLVETASHPNKGIYGILKELITKLPLNLSHYIFFSHIDYFYRVAPGETLDTVVTLMNANPSWSVASFSLKQLERCTCLAKVKINEQNKISALIPQDTTSVSEINALLLSVLFIHQRTLIVEAVHELQTNPYVEITLATNRGSDNALDLLMTYAEGMVNKLDCAMAQCMNGTADVFVNSIIFVLFDNFVRLLCPLCEYDQVAQKMTPLLSVTVPKIVDFMISYPSDERLQNSFSLFLYVFGSFAATLVKGGGMTELESKFGWLIKPNIRHMNDDAFLTALTSPSVEFEDSTWNDFLSPENALMNTIYQKYKPQFNRSVSPEVRQMDQLSLLAISKACNLLDDVLKFSGELTPELKQVFDQMMRVRNEFRQRLQNNGDCEKLRVMCLLLLRMDTNVAESKQAGDVILSQFEPNLVPVTLKRQRLRIPLTKIGISVLSQLLATVKHDRFRDVVAYALSQIEGFEGLVSIIEISEIPEALSNELRSFFEIILRLFNETRAETLLAVIQKMVKVIGGLGNFGTGFCDFVKDNWKRDSLSTSMFPVLYSIVGLYDVGVFDSIESREEWMLLCHRLECSNCTPEIFEIVCNAITGEMKHSKLICQTFYHAIKSSALSDNDVENRLKEILSLMQNCLITASNLGVVADLVWMIRKIIIDNHPRKALVRQLFLDECPSVTVKLAVLAFSIEPVRPYCNIKVQERDTISSYFVVSPNMGEEIVCFALPFDIRKEKTIVKTTHSNVYAFPILELTEEHFGDFGSLLKLFGTQFETDMDRALFYQAVARFSHYNAFLDQLTPDMISELAGRIHSFAYTNRSISSLFKVSSSFRVIDPSNAKIRDHPFFVIKRGNMCTYLSHLVKDRALIRVRLPTGGYLGLMSAPIEKACVRYSLIECPSGTVFPTGVNMGAIEPGDFDICVDIQSKRLSVNDKFLPFPQGSMFRLVVAIPDADDFNVQIRTYGFDECQSPPIAADVPDKTSYLVGHLPEISSLPENIRDLPELETTWHVLRPEERLMSYYIPPPVCLHVADGDTESSEGLIDFLKRLLHDRIGKQYATISLMRIASKRPKVALRAGIDLVTVLIESLECFRYRRFANKRFFFDLDQPAWSMQSRLNCMYMGLESEARIALYNLISEPITGFQMMARIGRLCADPNIHFCASNNRAVTFYRGKSVQGKQFLVAKAGLIAHCDLLVNETWFRFVAPPDENFTIPDDRDCPDWIFLGVTPSDNSYINDTILELLLLIKNFAYFAKSIEHKNTIKSALIDIWASGSPLGCVFVPEFIDMIQVIIPTTPADASPYYLSRLALLGKSLVGDCETMTRFYHSERKMLNSVEFRDLCLHFPEFFATTSLPTPRMTDFSVPNVAIDPGLIQSGFGDVVNMVRLMFRHYDSIVGFPFWEILPYWIRLATNLQANARFNPMSIHDQFVTEMREFVGSWTDVDTTELISTMSLSSLISEKFDEVKRIALESSLAGKFSRNVLLLRALLIHHCTYLRQNKRADVRAELWEATSALAHPEETRRVITSRILSSSLDAPSVSINRFAARKLITDGSGSPSHSIVSQMAVIYANKPNRFALKADRPWIVKFQNEPAIDAGGPSRELFSEIAQSIFEKTSRLCCRVGEFYVPYSATGGNDMEYRFIGAFIGIVLRNGYMQDLPFAPVVWKYLAFQPLSVQDVLATDAELKRFVDAVRDGRVGVQWVCKQWDGRCVPLPGHSASQLVHPSEREIYVYELLQARLDVLEATLEKVRSGFMENTGFNENSKFLTAAGLSYSAQGSPQITVQDLRSMVVFRSPYDPGHPGIQHFWNAIETFTPQERILFFKFVTSLTRKPATEVHIIINGLYAAQPDTLLPTASTCFGMLHLPEYTSPRICYQKLRYAIMNCATMDLT